MTNEEIEAFKDFRTPPPSFEDFVKHILVDIANETLEKKSDKKFEEISNGYYN